MFVPKDAFKPAEELSTDLWANYGIPEVLLVDNSGGLIRAMFTNGDVRLETDLCRREEAEEEVSW